MARFFFTILLITISVVASASESDTLIIMSYNLENFFHPEDDPEKSDEAFTPEGTNHWTMSRARTKAAKVARVIVSVNNWNNPQIVGLCEVEGPQAAEFLVKEGELTTDNVHYNVICYPTPDNRGIAPAMLYNPNEVKIISSYPISMSLPEKDFFTRDVLYAKISFHNNIFHVLVNHWPSKYGGEMESMWKRDYVAKQTRSVCDSIVATDASAAIVLLGDFNDVASSDALVKEFGAESNNTDYINLSSDTDKQSYKYQGEWGTIDHIIVSKSLCDVERPKFSVCDLPFLLEADTRFMGYKPYRTFVGQKFNNGYSDHLPVMIKIPIELK